jgi:DNA-binding NtrC family response regulator
MKQAALDIDTCHPHAARPRPILIVEGDEALPAEALRSLLAKGFSVERAAGAEDALRQLAERPYALAIVDSDADERQGMDLLARMHDQAPELPVVMTTAAATVRHAVEAMQRGAAEYLMKPVGADILETCVGQLLSGPSARSLSPQDSLPSDENPFITNSPQVRRILEAGRAVAGSRATVLITGESGTGKEVLAAYIHRQACHPEAPYVAVNCAALPDTLMESELFGYEKGAFTGALSRREGKFEQAGEGTLVLDEITEMPLALQAKLLRVLQERRIDRLGGDRPIPFKAQVIAISNRNLTEAVRQGHLREDLYYRINVIPLHLPPLRERREDIPLLVEHFLRRYSTFYQRKPLEIDAVMLSALQRSDWKGNVRELENAIERAVLMGAMPSIPKPEEGAGEAVGEDAAPLTIRPGLSVKAVEEALIRRTLCEVNDHRERAARMLGISVRTLRNKLREYKERTEELEKDPHR